MPTVHDMPTDRLPGLLIVDPDPRVRLELARGLEGAGWHVWVAADGVGALDAYRSNQGEIDVALIDLQLPGLQGAQILTELADIAPDLLRCAMSANVSPYAASAFRKMSDTPLFTKPLDPGLLACSLQEMVEPVHRH